MLELFVEGVAVSSCALASFGLGTTKGYCAANGLDYAALDTALIATPVITGVSQSAAAIAYLHLAGGTGLSDSPGFVATVGGLSAVASGALEVLGIGAGYLIGSAMR